MSRALQAKSAEVISVDFRRGRKTRAERLAGFTDASAGVYACHPWTGARCQGNGYGAFNDVHPETGARYVRTAHSAAWEEHNSCAVPKGMAVLHARGCVQLCCNPVHLRLGTRKENFQDAKAEGREPGRRKLNREQVLKIVALKRKHGLENWVLAERFGVSVTTIRAVLHGLSWGWLTGINQDKKSGRPRKARSRPLTNGYRPSTQEARL